MVAYRYCNFTTCTENAVCDSGFKSDLYYIKCSSSSVSFYCIACIQIFDRHACVHKNLEYIALTTSLINCYFTEERLQFTYKVFASKT
jgi:hypothetical protein